MKKLIGIIILISLATYVQGQILIPKQDYIPEIRQSRYSFAIGLIAGSHQSLISYAIMRENPDSTKEVIFITKNSFKQQIMGREISKANPEQINYIEEYGIDTNLIDNLWKLKYDKKPSTLFDIYGWAKGMGTPTESQFQMLAPYGITNANDFCYGENLFKLLIKASDPTWVGQYQNR